MKGEKSNVKSDALRADGNNLYSQKKFFDALLKYNESLCNAESGSEQLGLSYANRSAVYFEIRLFEKCLGNIQLAREHNYPQKNFEILKKREEKCIEMIKSQNQGIQSAEDSTFFKLSYPANKKIPFIANCLELRTNEKYGRHIITNRQLKTGDIVAIESPFCSILIAESRFVEVPKNNKLIRCSNCLVDNQLNMIPCPECCDAMFCSKECYELAYKKFHRYECPVICQLLKSGSVHMALKFLFIGLSAFGGSIDMLKNFINENDKSKATVFDYNWKELKWPEDCRNYLKALNSSSRSSKIFSLIEHQEILRNHPELNKMFEDNQKFINQFLHRQCEVSDLYFHGIFGGNLQHDHTQNSATMFSQLQQSIGSGYFAFVSLINHSCHPNVLRINVKGKVAVIVCRPIPKGSQLFDCYKYNFNKQPNPERQMRLQKEFGFKCDCEACEANFPCPPALSFKDVKLLKFAKKSCDEILTMKPGQAIKKYRDCCEIIDKNDHMNPCIEMSMLQKTIATFLLHQTSI